MDVLKWLGALTNARSVETAYALVAAWALVGSATAGPEADVRTALSAWSHAIETNDARAVGEYAADDWILIGTDGEVLTKGSFLAVIDSGHLTHEAMRQDTTAIRFYGSTAIASGVATSTGVYQGMRFETHERTTDVFVRSNGRWRCVLTQLAPVSSR